LYLKLFGGASIDTGSGSVAGAAAQRRRLALLARLALERSAGVSRDKLIAFFWPESGAEKSRHLLSDAIYRINQALGQDVIVAAGEQLRLDAALLPSDVAEFEDALARGDRAAAARSYTGPFLDGFFIEGALEFERWVESERQRLAQAFAGALEALAEAARERGDPVESVAWWRRLAAHDPWNSRAALGLVKALGAAGDRAAALQHARVHEALLRSDWGAEPAAEFAAAVAKLTKDAPPPVPVIQAAPTPSSSAPPPPRIRRRPAVVVWVSLVVGLFGFLVALRALGSLRADAAPITLAVLPFTDLSPAGDQEYFADGITEELITTLTGIERLRVPSRTSVYALKGRAMDVRDVGQRLDVAYVIEGSVRKAATRARITAQLVSTEDGYQLWAGTYDRDVADILAVQREIAAAIARTLQIRLAAGVRPDSAEPAPARADAYDLYLRGRYHWHRRTEASLRTAVAAFEEAVQRDPGYARAWAGLADGYAILGFYDWAAPRDVFPRARVAAQRAQEFEETRAEAEATLGYVSLYYDWDWPRAEEHFRRSIRLDPASSKARQWYANFLTATGRFSEAEREMRRAQELEPLSLIAHAALCWVWFYARRHDDAVRQCRATQQLDSTFVLAHLWRGWAWGALGLRDSATASLRQAVALSPDVGSRAALAYALGKAGGAGEAAALFASVRAIRATRYAPAYELAKAALGSNRRDEALAWLDSALMDRAHSIPFLEEDPQLDELRGDPRFTALLRRVVPQSAGLP
jgi:TolB-like protein/DNA-binding SARP family transcriptional activator/Tfp pilus assembly protein PilF